MSAPLRRARPLAAAVALVAATPAAALEPRFDHRDTHGPFAESLLSYDAVARPGATTATGWRTRLHAGWGFDVSGEGDDLLFGAAVAVPWLHDPDRMKLLLDVDARYRGYFGTEQLKTFFDVGAWAPLVSRLAIGPLVGIGVAWDYGRSGGVYAGASFATAFGQARIASLSVSAGAQFRFDVP